MSFLDNVKKNDNHIILSNETINNTGYQVENLDDKKIKLTLNTTLNSYVYIKRELSNSTILVEANNSSKLFEFLEVPVSRIAFIFIVL